MSKPTPHQFAEPWANQRRDAMIARIDEMLAANTKAYQEVRKFIKWESPRLDKFVGEATRLSNLRFALQSYHSEQIEKMKKGFDELDE